MVKTKSMLNLEDSPVARLRKPAHACVSKTAFVLAALLCLLPGVVLPTAAGEPGELIDFNSEVRPLLMQNCAGCHGGVMKSGGVSMIYRETVLGVGDSGKQVAIPGNADGSEMIRRVLADDPLDRMPPPDHGPALSAEDVETLKQWINQGAEWSEHWAFVPPKEHDLPEVERNDWPRRDMDVFLLAAMEREGFEPSPRAAPEMLLRRVALDLTGLPPTAEQVERMREDPSHETYEAIVDELLDSPAYGERWASMWLDLARYADTYGYEKDPHRDIWPYRDYVVRAFNQDKPYDEFSIEQLAGDLMPEAGAEQVIASAFHRNTQTNTEGGTDDEEFRVAAVMDRVATTWIAWQATTMNCVQCHSHPYDPIEHEEYFQSLDIFNQTEDADLDDDFPRFSLPNDGQASEEAVQLDRMVRQARRELNLPAGALAEATEWSAWRPAAVAASTRNGSLDLHEESAELRQSGTHPVNSTYTLSGAVPEEGIRAIRFDILPESDDPADWPENGSVLSYLRLFVVSGDGERRQLEVSEVFADAIDGPHDPMDVLQDNPAGMGDYPKLNRPRWGVVVLAETLTLGEDSDQQLELIMKQNARTAESQAVLLRRFTVSTSGDDRWHDLVVSQDRARLREEMIANRDRLAKLGGTRVPVMVERHPEARRETRMFIRGNWLEKGEMIQGGTPTVFPAPQQNGSADSDDPMNRLDFAQWMFQPDQPLTARVAVNRFWQQLFGVGIVETVEDFGSAGTAPWHPELLDHLALQFQGEMEWSMKSLLREMVTSAAYQQDNRVTEELWQRDPSNRYLARGPRLRLTAEMMRDQALAVSGLLSDKRYGRPVMPPQPDGIWNSVYSGAEWKPSRGEDRYRRALYTYWKRTSPYPSFQTFDAPARDICSARRLPTNTPLQALVTLNDEAYVEAAQALARRMAREGGESLADQVARGLELALVRPAEAEDVAILVAMHADVTAAYNQPDNAGMHEPLAATPEQAALVVVAIAILNLDATLSR